MLLSLEATTQVPIMKSKEIILGYQKRIAKPFAELVTLLLGGVLAIRLVGAIIDVALVRFYQAALRTPFGGNQVTSCKLRLLV